MKISVHLQNSWALTDDSFSFLQIVSKLQNNTNMNMNMNIDDKAIEMPPRLGI